MVNQTGGIIKSDEMSVVIPSNVLDGQYTFEFTITKTKIPSPALLNNKQPMADRGIIFAAKNNFRL